MQETVKDIISQTMSIYKYNSNSQIDIDQKIMNKLNTLYKSNVKLDGSTNYKDFIKYSAKARGYLLEVLVKLFEESTNLNSHHTSTNTTTKELAYTKEKILNLLNSLNMVHISLYDLKVIYMNLGQNRSIGLVDYKRNMINLTTMLSYFEDFQNKGVTNVFFEKGNEEKLLEVLKCIYILNKKTFI